MLNYHGIARFWRWSNRAAANGLAFRLGARYQHFAGGAIRQIKCRLAGVMACIARMNKSYKTEDI